MSRNSKPSTASFFFSWDRFTREKSVLQQTRWRFQICFFVHIWVRRIQLNETTSHVFIPFSKRNQFAFNAMLQPKLQIFVPEHKVRRGSRREGPTQLWRYPQNKHATNLFRSNHRFLWGVLLLAWRWLKLETPVFFPSHSLFPRRINDYVWRW